MQIADIQNTNIQNITTPMGKPRKNNNQRSSKQRTKQAAQNPLTLRGWIYAADGKHIKELIQASFLEFYFMSKAIKTTDITTIENNEICQNA